MTTVRTGSDAAAGSMLPTLVGTVMLAAAANTYELLCTAGFPMVFTRLLTLRALPPLSYYLYLVLYDVVYVIPLAVIVAIFTVTLGSRKLTEWQGRVLKLVSGTMMLGLDTILLVDPSLFEQRPRLAPAAGGGPGRLPGIAAAVRRFSGVISPPRS